MTRSSEANGRSPEACPYDTGIGTLTKGLIETTRSSEAKGRRPEACACPYHLEIGTLAGEPIETTRSSEAKGRKPEACPYDTGIGTLTKELIETTRSSEAKGRRPFAVNGAWKAPLIVKRRGWMPRLSNQINCEEHPRQKPNNQTTRKAPQHA
jgi:hypothetical protein